MAPAHVLLLPADVEDLERLEGKILNPKPKPLKREMLVLLCRRMTAKLSPADKARAEIPSDSGLIFVGLSEKTDHLATSWDSLKFPSKVFFSDWRVLWKSFQSLP